jgi:diketogulonate reductase-like aldo/keto reductase
VVIPEIKLSDGNSIPVFGLGTYLLQGKKCFEAVKKALDLGYNHIDTAEYYENEHIIGSVLQETVSERKELFITSKVWFTNLSYEDTIKACNASLKKLQTNYLDLYLIHWPKKGIDLNETLRAFKYLNEQGKVRSFGVSNFTINHLNEILPIAEMHGIKITMNQVEFHPGLYQKELLEFCTKNEIKLTAYSPLIRGSIGKYDLINALAEHYNKTSFQIGLKWILQKKVIAIPKASSEKHLLENMQIFDFELKEEDIEKIDALGNADRFVIPAFHEFDC